MANNFTTNSAVLVVPLNQIGTVISCSGNTYTIQIGSLTVRCKADDLQPAAPQKAIPAKNELPTYSKAEVRALAEIDLHGLTVRDAIDALESHINRAVMAGVDSFIVVHGLGTGKIKEAVYKRLGELPVIRKFQVQMNNPGSTVVFL